MTTAAPIMNLKYFASMRLARALCLSVIYMLLVLLMWKQINGWITTHASPAAAESLEDFGRPFVFGNSGAFACSLLWLARNREFSPLGRYVVPTVLAAGLTFFMGLVILAIAGISNLGYSVAPGAGVLIAWTDSVVPGFAGAQLFRFPRSDRRDRAHGMEGIEAV